MEKEIKDKNNIKGVFLTKEEIEKSNENKKNQKRLFNATPICRSLVQFQTDTLIIMKEIPRKFVKVTDIILEYISEIIRWCAYTYEIKNEESKFLGISEALSLYYSLRAIYVSLKNVKIISKDDFNKFMSRLNDINRQLVAWRSSINR